MTPSKSNRAKTGLRYRPVQMPLLRCQEVAAGFLSNLKRPIKQPMLWTGGFNVIITRSTTWTRARIQECRRRFVKKTQENTRTHQQTLAILGITTETGGHGGRKPSLHWRFLTPEASLSNLENPLGLLIVIFCSFLPLFLFPIAPPVVWYRDQPYFS